MIARFVVLAVVVGNVSDVVVGNVSDIVVENVSGVVDVGLVVRSQIVVNGVVAWYLILINHREVR